MDFPGTLLWDLTLTSWAASVGEVVPIHPALALHAAPPMKMIIGKCSGTAAASCTQQKGNDVHILCSPHVDLMVSAALEVECVMCVNISALDRGIANWHSFRGEIVLPPCIASSNVSVLLIVQTKHQCL